MMSCWAFYACSGRIIFNLDCGTNINIGHTHRELRGLLSRLHAMCYYHRVPAKRLIQIVPAPISGASALWIHSHVVAASTSAHALHLAELHCNVVLCEVTLMI